MTRITPGFSGGAVTPPGAARHPSEEGNGSRTAGSGGEAASPPAGRTGRCGQRRLLRRARANQPVAVSSSSSSQGSASPVGTAAVGVLLKGAGCLIRF